MTYIGYIYKIVNTVNQKFYVGQTRVSLTKRFISHKCASKNEDELKRPLYSAMRKYGIDMFIIESIEQIEGDTLEMLSNLLNDREIHYITLLNPEYNSAPGGKGHTGVSWTDERRAAFKESMSGPNNPAYGKPKSEETKQKLREKLTGRIITDEVRLRISTTMKGVPKSEETKLRMSNARKGYPSPKGEASVLSKQVEQLDLHGNVINKYGSVHEAARTLNCHASGISMCCRGRLNTSAGFGWRYL
jgi:group I intron endonuclease